MGRTLVFVVERCADATTVAVCATRSVAAGYAEYLTRRTGQEHGWVPFGLRETVPDRLPARGQGRRDGYPQRAHKRTPVVGVSGRPQPAEP